MKKIRIIGGQWKGRKLRISDTPRLRPTMDRVKETLFNWLSPVISNACCLDCFSGSGSLGIEALSRYAKSATLLEIEHTVLRQLYRNLAILKAHNATVVNTNTITYLKKTGTPYTVVFVDPPFHRGLVEVTLSLLNRNNWLENGALIYTESESTHTSITIPNHWKLYREKIAGKVAYRLFYRE